MDPDGSERKVDLTRAQASRSRHLSSVRQARASPAELTSDRMVALVAELGAGIDAGVDLDVALVSALTDALARVADDHERVGTVLDVYEDLRTALELRAPIEQAKGVLMAMHRVSDEQAFAILVARSQHANRKLRDIAVDLVREASTPQTAQWK